MSTRVVPLAAVSWIAWCVAPVRAEVAVGMLSYGQPSMTGRCFSDRFLSLAAREGDLDVDRALNTVELGSTELSRFGFVVMTGEGAFELSAAEVDRLGTYLRGGGFVLASAGCSSDAWAASMERAIERSLPGAHLQELSPEHPVFHACFDVSEFTSRKRKPARLYGIEIEGRLALLYSPQGLNDTNDVNVPEAPSTGATAVPPACCCCNGDEIVSAKYINSNALVYALLR